MNSPSINSALERPDRQSNFHTCKNILTLAIELFVEDRTLKQYSYSIIAGMIGLLIVSNTSLLLLVTNSDVVSWMMAQAALLLFLPLQVIRSRRIPKESALKYSQQAVETVRESYPVLCSVENWSNHQEQELKLLMVQLPITAFI